MPFIQRFVEPIHVSRTCIKDDNGQLVSLPNNREFEAVFNNTLSNELRQLASLLLIADSIFHDLGQQLHHICQRSNRLKSKVTRIQTKVDSRHPQFISNPEGDLCSFANRKNQYESSNELETGLFNAKSRSKTIQKLYNAAAKTPINVIRQLDDFRNDGARSSKFFECIPTFKIDRKKSRNLDNIDIETRIPAVIRSLRKWTSSEILGDLTVNINHPNQVISYTNSSNCDIDSSLHTNFNDKNLTFSRNGFISENDQIEIQNDNGVCHQLPSPEEQVQIIANKYSSMVVPIDVSGKLFNRISQQRRSLIVCEIDESKKRSKNRHRKLRASKRRNTIAGTEQTELREALNNAHSSSRSEKSIENKTDYKMISRSKSSEQLRGRSNASSSAEDSNKKPSHFSTIRQWSINTLRKLNKLNTSHNSNSNSNSNSNKIDSEDLEEYNKSLENDINNVVKLRDTFSIQRRLNRLGVVTGIKEEIHSSSGNWSASSESGRASIISESIPRPKSSSSNHSSVPNGSSVPIRRKFGCAGGVLTPATSDGTVTPDMQDLDGGETSSMYSCDAEGYYTSFHLDSGLKSFKEDKCNFSGNCNCNRNRNQNRNRNRNRNVPPVPLISTSTFVTINALSSDNEYDVFGKGSTSTTTSSAGTVCTALLKRSSNSPIVPERKSSLKSLDKKSGSDSPDSGHNTSSSPIESIHSPNGVRSGSEFDCSETSSDFDGSERIRVKTSINSSNIPSMCVIQNNLIANQNVMNENEGLSNKVFSFSNVNNISPIVPTGSSNDEASNENTVMETRCIVKHSTPKNALHLAKKSSMTNDQLYALIHQSKRKMNIKTDDFDNNNNNTKLSPYEFDKLKIKIKIKNNNNYSNSNNNLDFKKLLLEQNHKQSPSWLRSQKISAVEQLKLSRNSNGVIHNKSVSLDPLLIQNLTSSPKYLHCNRKLIQNINLKKKYSNQKYDVLSTSIPEAYCEDDTYFDNNVSSESCPTLETAL